MRDQKDKQIESALRKYAHYLASSEKEDGPQQYSGEEFALKLRVYSAYAEYMATKRIERLTVILAYSTLALAISTVVLAVEAILRIFGP